MTAAPIDLETNLAARRRARGRLIETIRRHPTVALGSALLLLMGLIAICAPFLGTVDPQSLSPIKRLRFPQEAYWFGTDMLGRDVYSRVLYGSRISLVVGLSVAAFSTVIGLSIGLVTGFSRITDSIVMRVMDGLMSIPPVLLAIALMALTRASVGNVIFAITVSEVPRVTRLVRSEMLEVLRADYIKFARARGLSDRSVNFGHALKNTLVPVITIAGLQLGSIIAFAIITETVFQWPGMGLLFIQAVGFADVPVMAAYLCLIALIFEIARRQFGGRSCLNLTIDCSNLFEVRVERRNGRAGVGFNLRIERVDLRRDRSDVVCERSPGVDHTLLLDRAFGLGGILTPCGGKLGYIVR